jgi:tetratricopeptide (TPR) repeat protein
LTDFGFLQDIRHLPQTTIHSDRSSEQKNYLPPEQMAGRPTTASDLYALGIIAIEALTQTKPALLPKDSQTGAILWRESIVVNRRLAKILDKMTHIDVGQRYQSAEQVINDLAKIKLHSHPASGHKLIQSRNIGRLNQGRLKPIHTLIALIGVLCFLGSMEFTFPTLRPLYYFYRGRQLLSEQPEIALNTFMKAIDLKPDSAGAWEGRGDALYQLERFPEALESYYEAIQLNSDRSSNYQTWQKKGDTLYNLESFSEALIAYDRALELKPDDSTILNQKGKTLYQLQRYQEALEVQEEALKIDRFNPQYLSDRATVLMDLGRYYDALTVFNRVQAIDPLNLRLWQNKAITLKYLDRPQESRRVYQEVMDKYDKIIKQKPQNKQIWLSKADFFLEFHKYQEANDAYDKAIAIVPNSYFAWLGKAKALNNLQEYDQALAVINKALNIRPKSALVWQVRGLIFHRGKRNLTEAIASYDRAIEFNPNFAPAWRDRGFALNEQGKYAQASESFAKASEIHPYDLDTWLGLATTLTAMEQNKQALFVLERALQIRPQEPSIWLQKGSILVKEQKYDEACQNYRQSRKVTPESAEILQAMQNLGCRME